jgi:predicted cobalt transporter CbtA
LTSSERSNVALIAALAAVVVVMVVVIFTLHRNSPLVATAPVLSASEPTTDGTGGIAPVRGRSGIER